MSDETFGQFCSNKKSVEEYLQKKRTDTPSEIERLRAENEKLREALQRAANDMRPMLRSMISRSEAAEIVRRAAAALKGIGDE